MKRIGRSIIDKFSSKSGRAEFMKRQKEHGQGEIKSIAVLFFVPKANKEKYSKWEDGFTKGIDLLDEDYKVTWINLEDSKPTADQLNQFDFLIVKSGWNWIVDRYVRSLKGLTSKRGIVISCSVRPKEEWAWFYDVLWYQTQWYYDDVKFHPNTILSYGVNSDVFKPMNVEKKYDVLSIGAITAYKRFEKLNDIPGTHKLIIGSTATKDFEEIKRKLDPNIEIIDYVSQPDLAKYINESKLVYVACETQGGGERALMEAMCCGVPVKVEPDNPKLLSLLENNIPITKFDYSNAIRRGLQLFEPKVRITNELLTDKNLRVGRNSFYNKNFRIKGRQKVTIGSYCSFGEDIKIITENHDTAYPSTQGFLYRKYLGQNHPGELQSPPSKERTKGPVFIGNDVWIGDNVTILSGVTIGDGACIATGSIVVKDIAPYSIVGGVPAKHLKFRFSEEIIEFLQQLEWWNWSNTRIKNNAQFFNSNLNEVPVYELKKMIVA